MIVFFMNYLILKPGDDIVDVDRAVDQHRQRENISKYTVSFIFRHTYYIRHHRKTDMSFGKHRKTLIFDEFRDRRKFIKHENSEKPEFCQK